MQARVTVVDEVIKEHMNNNHNEGIRMQLTNPSKQVVIDKIAKPDELLTY